MNQEKFTEAYNRYLEKQKTKTKINLVLDDLYRIVTITQQNIFLWGQMYEGIRKRPEIIDLFSLFIITSSNLINERIILDICKLFNKDKDSINTDFLHNLILNEGRKYLDNKVYEEMKKQVITDKNKLEQFNELILGAKAKRDRQIAHLDKKTLGFGFDKESKVELKELSITLESIEAIYSNYYKICGYHKLSSFEEYLISLEGFGVTTTFDDLFNLIDFALDNVKRDEQSETIKKVLFNRRVRQLTEAHEQELSK